MNEETIREGREHKGIDNSGTSNKMVIMTLGIKVLAPDFIEREIGKKKSRGSHKEHLAMGKECLEANSMEFSA